VIDLHCHVLPGIDDGPENRDAALQLARAARDAGTELIVATPHVNHAFPGNDAARIATAVDDFRSLLGAAGIDLEIRTGAELALTRAGELADAELDALRLGGGPFLLVECPDTPSATGFDRALHSLQVKGHRILLAHAERIPAFQRDLATLQAFVDRGMLVQVTAASVAGKFGKPVREFADQLLRASLVHDIASDAHSVERRGPDIAAHLQAAGWESHIEHFAHAVPLAILDGTPIPPMPPPPTARRRGLFARR
jgi:protein-tyrosine phosphatase